MISKGEYYVTSRTFEFHSKSNLKNGIDKPYKPAAARKFEFLGPVWHRINQALVVATKLAGQPT